MTTLGQTRSPEARANMRAAALRRGARERTLREPSLAPGARRSLTAPFEAVLTALSDLARARGHVMSPPRYDENLAAAMQCRRCQRWIVFAIPNSTSGEVPELRGDALGYCPGTRYGPVATTDDGLRASR